MKKIAILAALLLTTSACSYFSEEGGDSMGSGNADVAALIKEATGENKKAAKMGGLWRDANKMIKKAKAALEKGDTKKAMKLAKTAKEQGMLGQVQAKEQMNAAPWLF